jgi:ABC-type hemin transport system ATPase subunit
MEKRMSLNWDIAETTAYKNKDQYKNFDFILDAVVFSTMAVDIGQIKNEDLADQYVDRILLIESNFGKLYLSGTPRKSLLADRELIKAFIGLRTNVTTMPFNKWYKTKILDRRFRLYEELKNVS